MTFAEEIEEYVGEEKIEAIVVGPNRSDGWWDFNNSDHNLGNQPTSWELARPVLDYHYDDGYGGQDCHNILVWTPTRVISVHEYDGSTGLIHVPRHPATCKY